VSNKVPGQAEKWDDVIRQLTSVWTPESAARVLAAIAQLDLHGSSSEGDVITRVGDRFVPRTPGGGSELPAIVFPDGLGGALIDTDPHNFALDLEISSVVNVGGWTLNGSGDLVAPVSGLYECVFSVQLQRHATEESLVACAINSATSDTELGPVLVQAPASADASAIDLDARTFTDGVTAGQSFGTLQLTQTNGAATGRNVFSRLIIRCLALS
jgi:hypothetical protein